MRKIHIVIPKSKKLSIINRPNVIVRQRDLEEFFLLTRRFREIELRWRQKREWLLASLRDGAMVEEGVHLAKVVQLERLVTK